MIALNSFCLSHLLDFDPFFTKEFAFVLVRLGFSPKLLLQYFKLFGFLMLTGSLKPLHYLLFYSLYYSVAVIFDIISLMITLGNTMSNRLESDMSH